MASEEWKKEEKKRRKNWDENVAKAVCFMNEHISIKMIFT